MFFLRIVRLTHAGIYQKWLEVATYGILHKKINELQVAFNQAKVADFEGPAYVSGIGLLLALVTLIIENFIILKYKKKEQRRMSYFHSGNKNHVGVQRRTRKRLFEVNKSSPLTRNRLVYW